MKILMVCLGNICRSPLAEGVMRHKAEQAGLDWYIDSAGTSGHQVGCAPHHLSQKVAREFGIDISNTRCRNFKREDIHLFDRIYVMDSENYDDVRRICGGEWNPVKVDYLLNELRPGTDEDIFDPWYGGEEGFYEVYHMINEACEAIIRRYAAKISLQNT